MPLVNEYQLDNYCIDGIDYMISFIYRPTINLNLTVPGMPVIVLSPLVVASDTPKNSITALTVPGMPTIGVATSVT
jgi:hypothetical protein